MSNSGMKSRGCAAVLRCGAIPRRRRWMHRYASTGSSWCSDRSRSMAASWRSRTSITMARCCASSECPQRSSCKARSRSSHNSTRRWKGSTARARCSAPSARPRVSGGSRFSPTARTCWRCSAPRSWPIARVTRCCSATAMMWSAACSTMAGTGYAGKIRSPSPVTCLRWWREILNRSMTHSSPPRVARYSCAFSWSPRISTNARSRCRHSSRRCAGTSRSTGANTISMCS